MKYSFKKTLLKMAKYLVLFGAPFLVNQFIVEYPEYAQLSVGVVLVGLVNLLKVKFGVKYS